MTYQHIESQASLSATSSIDKIEKYLKRKFSTLRAQKTHKIPQSIKIKKKEKNNPTASKKKAEDLMKLFLNDSSHLNLTDRIKGNRLVQKSDDNSAYYNKYCTKNKVKNKKRVMIIVLIIINIVLKIKSKIKKGLYYKNLIVQLCSKNQKQMQIWPKKASKIIFLK